MDPDRLLAGGHLAPAGAIGDRRLPAGGAGGDLAFHDGRKRFARFVGLLVGWGSIIVGIAGLLWHLNADFFQQQTLKNLVYTAPFVAPLAYTGIGLLLILDRMVDSRSLEWSRWVILLAAGGFVGNFVLSLADHAQNGFFYPSEWIGVVGGAVAVGFLVAVVVVPENASLLLMNLALMAIQVVVGLARLLPSRPGRPGQPGQSRSGIDSSSVLRSSRRSCSRTSPCLPVSVSGPSRDTLRPNRVVPRRDGRPATLPRPVRRT